VSVPALRARIVYGDLDLTAKPFMWEFGGQLGTPELVRQVLQQQLQDGEIVSVDRASNRTLELTFQIESDDLGACAIAEAQLALEAAKPRNTLMFDPGDGFAPVTVFDTFPAALELDRDDELEQHGLRRYTAEIPALPYARSKDLVTVDVPAPPATIAEVEVDDGSSTTGWTGSDTVTTSGGRVWVPLTYVAANVWNGWLERGGLSVSLTGLPYLRVVCLSPPHSANPGFKVNGADVTVVARSGDTYWLDVSAVSVLNTLRVTMFTISSTPPSGWVDDVAATNTLTTGSTGRQNARQIPVSGSARAQASLSLNADPDPLGTVLVHTTSRTGVMQPPLRTALIPGPTQTTDGSTVSGATSNLGTIHHFDLPATVVADGGHLLLARVKDASAGDVSIAWSAVSRMGDPDDLGSYVDVGETESGTHTATLAAGEWTVVTVAALIMPPTRVGRNGYVRVSLSGPAGLLLDEAWLFDVENGRLTWIDAGESFAVWLDVASIEDPVSSLWRGNNFDRSDQIHAGPDTQSWGVHEFIPPLVDVFTVTTESTAAELALDYYPRWHTHAAL
jgi:hypothetical protein